MIIVGANFLDIKVRMQGPLRLDPAGYEMPLDVLLFARGTGNTDADVLADTPVSTLRCENMTKGAGNDLNPRGECSFPVTQVGTFDVAVKSDRTLLHVKRAVAVPGAIDFSGPAHDSPESRGLHEGDMNEDGTINILDFSLFLDTWLQGCTTTPSSISDFSTGDYDKNCSVNALDFTIFLDNWREDSPQED